MMQNAYYSLLVNPVAVRQKASLLHYHYWIPSPHTHLTTPVRNRSIPPSFTDTLTQLPTSSCILYFSHLLMPVYFLLTTSCHSCMYVFLCFISHKLRPVAPSNASLCRCMYNNVILSSLWCQMLSSLLLLLLMIIVQIE